MSLFKNKETVKSKIGYPNWWGTMPIIQGSYVDTAKSKVEQWIR